MLKAYPKKIDLENCEDEPIHLIPNVQNHGFVLVVDDDQIVQCSSNLYDFTGKQAQQLLKQSLSALFSEEAMSAFQKWKRKPLDHIPFQVTINSESFLCIPHANEEVIVLDFEPLSDQWDASEFQQEMLSVYRKLSVTKTLQELTDRSAELIKELLGYDRVMVYRFDEDWNGTVFSEAKEDRLEGFKGLWYPASDIPEMARKLFLKQGVRLLSDISETYSHLTPTVNPKTGSLTNVSNSHMRGSSPIHIEYLNNMKVGATLNCAIVVDHKLWGLVSCHHYSKKYVDFQRRQSVMLLSEMLSNQLAQQKTAAYLANLKDTSAVRTKLLDHISKDWDIINGLTVFEPTAIDIIKSDGFAICYEGEIETVGDTPSHARIWDLLKQLNTAATFDNGSFATNCLKKHVKCSDEEARAYAGTLTQKLTNTGENALIWFRPEQPRTVTWAGNPYSTKNAATKEARLSPRKSFEKWTEQVEYTSTPWADFELAATAQLAQDVKNVIVTKFGEISELNKKLESLNKELESFSYSISHDLRGPLRGIDGFAQILIEDYSDVLDDMGKKSLNHIINSAERMNELMDGILSYSGLSQKRLAPSKCNVNQLCDEVIVFNDLKNKYPEVTFSVQDDLPTITGDRAMVFQLFSNLLSNAFKYSSKSDKPKVSITAYTDGNHNIFEINDNGIGFDMKYIDKIFGIFTRLDDKAYKGTGVGLAIVQRIIQKHNGEIWA
ncbi:MAG: ATP-binding protein, partial [Marinirhabdus sp.]|nr:ATP-binding protein [Marinirhabdus sp.]